MYTKKESCLCWFCVHWAFYKIQLCYQHIYFTHTYEDCFIHDDGFFFYEKHGWENVDVSSKIEKIHKEISIYLPLNALARLYLKTSWSKTFYHLTKPLKLWIWDFCLWKLWDTFYMKKSQYECLFMSLYIKLNCNSKTYLNLKI